MTLVLDYCGPSDFPTCVDIYTTTDAAFQPMTKSSGNKYEKYEKFEKYKNKKHFPYPVINVLITFLNIKLKLIVTCVSFIRNESHSGWQGDIYIYTCKTPVCLFILVLI